MKIIKLILITVSAFLASSAFAEQVDDPKGGENMSDAIVEIRDYTIDPEWFDAYKDWAKNLAGPWLKKI